MMADATSPLLNRDEAREKYQQLSIGDADIEL